VNGGRALPLALPAGDTRAELHLSARAEPPAAMAQTAIALAVAQFLGLGADEAPGPVVADWRFAERWWWTSPPQGGQTTG
jgi:hypothetical protein